MKIRKAILKDVPQMLEIIKVNSPKYPKKLALTELREMFSKSLIKPTYLVVEEKGKIMAFNGYIHSWTDNMIVEIFWGNTHKDFQSKGIQTKLMKELIKVIKNIKKPKVKLILFSTKIPLFFKKFGFIKIGQKYDRNYVLMAKKLK